MLHIEEHYSGYSLVILFIFVLFATPSFLYAQDEPMEIYTNNYDASGGGVAFNFYPSGYSDGWYWGETTRHSGHGSHEMLSGEWAAGIFYNGIHDNKMQWLADWFIVPNWQTHTSFHQNSNYQVWNNHRAARSEVNDLNIRVTIDYNLVDLGANNYASLAFLDYSGNIKNVNSERYILLQRYTIKNESGSAITGLEFYQMLHGHPIATFSAIINSTYTDVNLPYTLKGYDPCNPSKSFRYAITQWNYDDGNTGHVDWESFSSTIEPDWIDNGTYKGHSDEPPSGTHKRIENRTLNSAKWFFLDEAAGAMGWKLPDLADDESTSITIAVMFGSGNVQLSVPNVWNITKNPHTQYTTIGAAVSDADSGDTIVVYPGVYKENVNFDSKQLTLQSIDPSNPLAIAGTIILSDSVAVIGANGSILDGLTIVGGYEGIDCFSSSQTINMTINRCRIANSNYGILGGYGNLTINRCKIEDNIYDGIIYDGISYNLGTALITDTTINNNGASGIFISNGSAEITNSIIHNNTGSGIYLNNCSSSSKIFNNTIVNNSTFGIWRDSGSNPDVNSNIIYYNTSQLNGISDSNVNYNCIENYTGGTNINSNPQFRDANNYDYHLKYNSPCIDMGDPNFSSSTEKDIDGENRIMDGDCSNNARVDMGADEFKIVDFISFSIFARAWRTDPNNPKWNAVYDFVADNIIDAKDLAVFVDYWLLPSDWSNGGEGTYFANNSSSSESMPPEQQEDETESIFDSNEEFVESQEDQSEENQYYYRADYNLPAIYLTCDNNNPEPNDEVTVWIHCDSPLICMGLSIYVAGDANITTAMGEADCNEYGWDNGWRSDPSYLDDIDYWVYLSGVRWDADASGVISYVKFRYNSGQVNISFDQENSMASTWDWESGSGSLVPLSQEAVIVAHDPNDP